MHFFRNRIKRARKIRNTARNMNKYQICMQGNILFIVSEEFSREDEQGLAEDSQDFRDFPARCENLAWSARESFLIEFDAILWRVYCIILS
jgi:RNase P protein component